MRKFPARPCTVACMHWFRRHPRGRAPHPDVLTPAEWRVLQHVREGRHNAEIATRLGVSVHTVKSHVSSMLAKLELHDRGELAAWDGEPLAASRAAMRRFRLGAPLTWTRDTLAAGWPMKAAVAVAVLGITVGGATALYTGLQNATEAPPPPASVATEPPPIVEPTLDPPAEPTQDLSAFAPELFLDQIGGLRGCDQPVFVRAGGLPPLTRVRVERLDNLAVQFTADTPANGFLNARADETLTDGCIPGTSYEFRVADEATATALATTSLSIPAPTTAEIVIEPAIGGCDEIVVTFRGFPPDMPISFFAWEAEPFAHNGFQVIFPSPVTDADGVARSGPFKPPWDCNRPALALSATAGEGEDGMRAELLYYLALTPNEPIPALIPALACKPGTACIQIP